MIVVLFNKDKIEVNAGIQDTIEEMAEAIADTAEAAFDAVKVGTSKKKNFST